MTLQLPDEGEISTAVRPSSVLHRSLHEAPRLVDYTEGNYIYLKDGRRILDATGGAAVSCIGHGNQRVAQAIHEQTKINGYCHSMFFASNAVEDLAHLMIESTYGDMGSAFFVSSGSEAMEAALKFASQYHLEKRPSQPSRTHFISRKQSYHGGTLGALGVSGHVGRRKKFEPLLGVPLGQVSPCFEYRPARPSLSTEEHVAFLEEELENEFIRLGPENVAAFIAEPVVGAALGCVAPIPQYFKAMERVCRRHGALLIFDEVMCGSGRVGPRPTLRYPRPLHAYQDPLIDVVPDILTLGKGLGGGYQPIAAMLVREEIVETLSAGSGVFSHGQTYQGHPIACAVATEVQAIIQDDNLVENVRNMGGLLGELLHQHLGSHANVGNIRGMGLFWALEFVKDKSTKQPFDANVAVAQSLHQLGLQAPHNICLYPGTGTIDGEHGDHIMLAPAYNCTPADILEIVETTRGVIEQFFSTI